MYSCATLQVVINLSIEVFVPVNSIICIWSAVQERSNQLEKMWLIGLMLAVADSRLELFSRAPSGEFFFPAYQATPQISAVIFLGFCDYFVLSIVSYSIWASVCADHYFVGQQLLKSMYHFYWFTT
jgi:hypothetical protein